MDAWARFYGSAVDTDYIVISPDGQVREGDARNHDELIGSLPPIYPGTFDPLTSAHLGVCEAVREAFGGCVCEVTARPCSGNGRLLDLDVLRRVVRQFEWKYTVLVTKRSTYERKRELFSAGLVHFVMGIGGFRAISADTWLRGTDVVVVARTIVERETLIADLEGQPQSRRHYTVLGPVSSTQPD